MDRYVIAYRYFDDPAPADQSLIEGKAIAHGLTLVNTTPGEIFVVADASAIDKVLAQERDWCFSKVSELDPLSDRWNLDAALREGLRMFEEPAQDGGRTWYVTFPPARFEFSVRLQRFGCTFVLTCERIDTPSSPTYSFLHVGDLRNDRISDAVRDRLSHIVYDETQRDAE